MSPLGGIACVTAGLLLGSIAAAVRERTRRRALNRGLHELRRPLQVLALRDRESRPQQGAGSAGELELAIAAAAELDALVNFKGFEPGPRQPLDAGELAERALERWRSTASLRGRTLGLVRGAGPLTVLASPTRLAAALDNLIANALEHGGRRVTLSLGRCDRGVRLEVRDSGRLKRASRSDPRRGHGLTIVRRVAVEHGGTATLRVREPETVATLELPGPWR